MRFSRRLHHATVVPQARRLARGQAIRRLPAVVLLLLAAARAAAQPPPATPPATPTGTTTVRIAFLRLAPPRHIASAVLTPTGQIPRPEDDARDGAKLAIGDVQTTGRFLNQTFTLDAVEAPDAASLLAAFARAEAAGEHLFVADAPPALLLKLADAASPGTLLLDATSSDDALRGAQCRADMLHILPSRAMLADALMQYFASKNWTRLMLLTGQTAPDQAYAAAIRRAAQKFQLTLAADRPWTFNPAAQQSDTGHYQVNAEVDKITEGVRYDVLIAADEAGNFGNQLAYRSFAPRPVAGTAGLTPAGWSPVMDEYGATQLQLRYLRSFGRPMTDHAYGGWLAVRALGEAALRTASADAGKIAAYLKGPDFTLSGYKGPPFSFRPWDGQLRQPVLLVDQVSLVSISPQPGYLHQTNTLDTLGEDQPETSCHFH